MKTDKLWKKFWQLADDNPEEALKWVETLILKEPNNVEYRYLKLEALRWNNLDAEDYQEEPLVMNMCTAVIKEKHLQNPITVAKAYCYRGEMKYRHFDRQKDFDKAKELLKGLPADDPEVKFLDTFIKVQYPLNFREYLFVDMDYRNMFKF